MTLLARSLLAVLLALIAIADLAAQGLGALQNRGSITPVAERLARLAAAKSWGYQLRRVDPAHIAAAPYDLVVVDYARARSQDVEYEFTRDEVETMRARPDGTKRIVIAYLSIGEAEWYRYYWQREWQGEALPKWIGPMNPAWYGNFPVRFWDPDWQRILFETETGYLDRILAAGFDGIYLDRVDVYEEFLKERPRARDDMAALLGKLRREVDRRRPGTLIIQQNAEELMALPAVRRDIDGIAKESLHYGLVEQHTPNAAKEVAWSEKHLQLARKAGRRVMVVEYVDEPPIAATARRRIEESGFLATFAPKLLHALPVVPVDRQPTTVVWPPKPPAFGPLHAPRPDNF